MEPQVNPTLFVSGPPVFSRPAPPAFRAAQASQNDALQGALAAAATAAVWIGCLVVGILGVLLPYAREHLEAKPPPPPVQAVRLMPPREQAPVTEPPQAAPKLDAAPPPDAPAPDAPPPLAVAAPDPSIAFAIPVEGPTRIVDAKYAVPVAARPSAYVPPVQHLKFGVGEGRQPDPEYPRDAIDAREQGTVVIRFTVGPDGRVQSAAVSQPCQWPLLNQAALRAVRNEWRLSPGKAGTYDVPIQFVLTGS
jgi:protein TonB